eukprot:g6195.t1
MDRPRKRQRQEREEPAELLPAGQCWLCPRAWSARSCQTVPFATGKFDEAELKIANIWARSGQFAQTSRRRVGAKVLIELKCYFASNDWCFLHADRVEH